MPRPTELYTPREVGVEELWDAQISSGINFSKYDNIPVKVTGENRPPPVGDFRSSGLAPALLEAVRRAAYSVPTPVQRHGLPIIQAGRDLMACAQTGSGKTAAFLLPILHHVIESGADPCRGRSAQAPTAVIMTPTRELAIQIYDEARKFASGSAVRAGILYGGTGTRYQADNLRAEGCHVLVATPGRLLDFAERGHIKFDAIRFFVLDEADRMLDMGFMPDIRRVVEHPGMPRRGDRQTLMFSATFPAQIRRLAEEFLQNYLFLQVGPGPPPSRSASWAAPAPTSPRSSTAPPSTRRRTCSSGRVSPPSRPFSPSSQHPGRGGARRDGADVGVRGDEAAGGFPVPEPVRGGIPRHQHPRGQAPERAGAGAPLSTS